MKEKIMERMQEHLNYLKNKGYDVIYIGLQGSQNYQLDIYDDEYISDIDTKAIILPNFKDFVYNKSPVSITEILPNNEHIDVKDVRVMFDTFKKQNVNFIEILFTEYNIKIPEYEKLLKPLFDNKEEIAHLNFNQAVKCMAGMSKEKLKALKHPYPTIIDKIEKYGYDPKQLHHILRMNDFIKKYALYKMPYEECLIPDDREFLIKIKKGILLEKDATELALMTDNYTYEIKEYVTKFNDNIINKKAIDILDNVKYELLKYKFKKELK